MSGSHRTSLRQLRKACEQLEHSWHEWDAWTDYCFWCSQRRLKQRTAPNCNPAAEETT